LFEYAGEQPKEEDEDMDEDFNEDQFETIFMQWSFEEIRFYSELMWKQSVDCVAQAMKGIDDSLQWWHQPTVKDKFVAEEDERNMHKQPDQILNMKLQRQRKKAKHRAFSINAKMKKMTRLEQYRVWKKRKKKPNSSEKLKSSFIVMYCKPS
jgi:hypothetical protein